MSKEAIELLEKGTVIYNFKCRVCGKYSGNSNSPSKHYNDCPIEQALTILKQQPPAGEWTKKLRNDIGKYKYGYQEKFKVSAIVEQSEELCDRLDTSEARLKVICEAMKSRISFIGLPSEPMNENGPDWSKEIALIEATIAPKIIDRKKHGGCWPEAKKEG